MYINKYRKNISGISQLLFLPLQSKFERSPRKYRLFIFKRTVVSTDLRAEEPARIVVCNTPHVNSQPFRAYSATNNDRKRTSFLLSRKYDADLFLSEFSLNDGLPFFIQYYRTARAKWILTTIDTPCA